MTTPDIVSWHFPSLAKSYSVWLFLFFFFRRKKMWSGEEKAHLHGYSVHLAIDGWSVGRGWLSSSGARADCRGQHWPANNSALLLQRLVHQRLATATAASVTHAAHFPTSLPPPHLQRGSAPSAPLDPSIPLTTPTHPPHRTPRFHNQNTHAHRAIRHRVTGDNIRHLLKMHRQWKIDLYTPTVGR